MAAAARDWIFRVETGSSGNSAPGSGTAHKQVGDTMVELRKWPRPLGKKNSRRRNQRGRSGAVVSAACAGAGRRSGVVCVSDCMCVCDITATSWDFARDEAHAVASQEVDAATRRGCGSKAMIAIEAQLLRETACTGTCKACWVTGEARCNGFKTKKKKRYVPCRSGPTAETWIWGC